MAPKWGLGKGLDALFPSESREEPPALPPEPVKIGVPPAAPASEAMGGAERLVPLERIRANPAQPRKRFEEEGLKELAESIRTHGIIQPIIVDDAGDGGYLIVAGERRFRAAGLAGLSEVPVLVRSYSDEKRLEVALIENVQRSDLNPLEEAAAYKRLMELTGRSQEEVAESVGKNRSTVANALRLLKLPAAMRESLEAGELSPGHGRALLAVPEGPAREKLYREILDRGLSVREAEKRAASRSEGETEAETKGGGGGGGKKTPDVELKAIEEKFIRHLGTKVSIQGDFKGGKIVIEYFSMEDLDRLYTLLGGGE